jgi:hypothetical protein
MHRSLPKRIAAFLCKHCKAGDAAKPHQLSARIFRFFPNSCSLLANEIPLIETVPINGITRNCLAGSVETT